MGETIMSIKRNHPVRRAFCSRSTGNDRGTYYSTKGAAIDAFDAELQAFDLCLDTEDMSDFLGNEGRKNINVCDEHGNCVGLAVFTWFRMESGRYEFIGYLA